MQVTIYKARSMTILLAKGEDRCHLCSSGGSPGGPRGKEPTCQCRRRKRLRFNHWVGKTPWRRAWQPTLAFLPGESHGQGNPGGSSPRGHKELDTTEAI